MLLIWLRTAGKHLTYYFLTRFCNYSVQITKVTFDSISISDFRYMTLWIIVLRDISISKMLRKIFNYFVQEWALHYKLNITYRPTNFKEYLSPISLLWQFYGSHKMLLLFEIKHDTSRWLNIDQCIFTEASKCQIAIEIKHRIPIFVFMKCHNIRLWNEMSDGFREMSVVVDWLGGNGDHMPGG